MLAKGLIGEKSGQGFYKRVKGAAGESDILTLDHGDARVPATEGAEAPVA